MNIKQLEPTNENWNINRNNRKSTNISGMLTIEMSQMFPRKFSNQQMINVKLICIPKHASPKAEASGMSLGWSDVAVGETLCSCMSTP